MTNNEQTIWEGSSSQVLNFGTYFFGIIFLVILVSVGINYHLIGYALTPLVCIYMLWQYLLISQQSYKLTNERLILTRGVLNKVTDELELYRVKDHRLEKPLFLRIFGLGNIILITSDKLNKEVRMIALKDSEKLKESLRRLVEDSRRLRNVREIDSN
jgi:uncharacterized membrane protein YdbT with pleckstrin-like domain